MVMYTACTNIFSPYRIKLSQWGDHQNTDGDHQNTGMQGQPKLAVGHAIRRHPHIARSVYGA